MAQPQTSWFRAILVQGFESNTNGTNHNANANVNFDEMSDQEVTVWWTLKKC